mmetsp:Transcript_35208/g.48865  ORF Transcript_35208/g.48865 Transcript_35208/m.48865 type:complete len:217 (-) Transcript_35208:246-896(-)
MGTNVRTAAAPPGCAERCAVLPEEMVETRCVMMSGLHRHRVGPVAAPCTTYSNTSAAVATSGGSSHMVGQGSLPDRDGSGEDARMAEMSTLTAPVSPACIAISCDPSTPACNACRAMLRRLSAASSWPERIRELGGVEAGGGVSKASRASSMRGQPCKAVTNAAGAARADANSTRRESPTRARADSPPLSVAPPAPRFARARAASPPAVQTSGSHH